MAAGGVFGTLQGQNTRLNDYLQSNLTSSYIPGENDIYNTFSSAMKMPFTKQPGGGVGPVQYQRELIMDEMNPALSQDVMGSLQDRNFFASMLESGASQNAQLYNMWLTLQALQKQAGNSATAGLGGALGALGGGLGF